MIPQPTIVKIVVPIPPVAGRAESFVSLILAVPVVASAVWFSPHLTIESSSLIE